VSNDNDANGEPEISEKERHCATYRIIVRAMLKRSGGHLRLSEDEIPTGSFTIFWRWTEDDGLEARLDEQEIPRQ